MDNTIKTLESMPFYNLNNHSLMLEFQNCAAKYMDIFQNNGLHNFIYNNVPYEMCSTFDCKYYEEAPFTTAFNNKRQDLSGLHVNLQSSLKNLGLLKANLMNLEYTFKIIAITEMGNRSLNQLSCTFPDYNIYYKSPTMAKGGVAAFIQEGTFDMVSRRSDLESDNPAFETIWLELKHGNDTFVIGIIYRHPNPNNTLPFIEYLDIVTHTVVSEKKTMFILGDINIDLLKTSHNTTNNYLDILLPRNIIPCITVPTRITD